MKIFNGIPLRQFLQKTLDQAQNEVTTEDKDKLLNSDEAVYIDYLVKKCSHLPPQLLLPNQYITHKDIKVLGERFPGRGFDFGVQRNESYEKQAIYYHIPFSGNKIFLEMKPSQYIMWTKEVEIQDSEIVFEVINWNDDPEQIKREAFECISRISELSNNLSNEIISYNNSLKGKITKIVQERKKDILKKNNLVESLGVPLKKAENVPSTFSVPIQAKKLIIEKPSTSNKPFIPEPTLSQEIYQHILKISHDYGVVLERLPNMHKDKNEEALRDSLIMTLTPHFEYEVTGETFNKKGKTDILIRYQKENVFVAECKFWNGQVQHRETIDQILSEMSDNIK